MNPAIFPAAPLPASAALQDLIATMRKAAQRWDYDQHDEHDVLAWADRLEALSRADQP